LKLKFTQNLSNPSLKSKIKQIVYPHTKKIKQFFKQEQNKFKLIKNYRHLSERNFNNPGEFKDFGLYLKKNFLNLGKQTFSSDFLLKIKLKFPFFFFRASKIIEFFL
jgi:hypothetical protein